MAWKQSFPVVGLGPTASGTGGVLHSRDQGSSFALAACAAPSDAHIPPHRRGTGGQYSPKCWHWRCHTLGGNMPSEAMATPPATHGVCVQAAAETQLSHPWCCRCAMGRGAGWRGASRRSTSALHRQMLSCEAEGRCPGVQVEAKLGLETVCAPGEGFFQSRGDLSSVLHCGL